MGNPCDNGRAGTPPRIKCASVIESFPKLHMNAGRVALPTCSRINSIVALIIIPLPRLFLLHSVSRHRCQRSCPDWLYLLAAESEIAPRKQIGCLRIDCLDTTES